MSIWDDVKKIGVDGLSNLVDAEIIDQYGTAGAAATGHDDLVSNDPGDPVRKQGGAHDTSFFDNRTLLYVGGGVLVVGLLFVMMGRR